MKRTLLLVLGLVMVVWLAACGGNDNNDLDNENNNSNNNEVGNNDNTNDDGGDKEEVTLRIAWWGEQTRNDGTNEVIEMFEDENPHITIEAEYAGWDDNTISGGEVVDGIYGFNIGVNAVGFQYNEELLDEIGVGPLPEEWTWDDYVELADDAADEGYYFDTGMQPDVFFNYYLRTHGERLYSEDGSVIC